MHRWTIATVITAAMLQAAAAQGSPQSVPRTVFLGMACSYFDEALPQTVAPSPSSAEAQTMIKRIVDASGLARNFQTLAAPVPNATAVTINGQRLILYNPAFIATIREKTHNKWAAISIMAHEVGHHLNGHLLTNPVNRPALELEADYFSGFILQRLGASLADSRAAMEAFGSNVATATHPAKPDRLASITTGWTKACEKDPDCRLDQEQPFDFEKNP